MRIGSALEITYDSCEQAHSLFRDKSNATYPSDSEGDCLRHHARGKSRSGQYREYV